MAKKKKNNKKKKHVFEKKNVGDRSADIVTSFVGSWKFIIIFFIIFALWVGVNIYFLFAPWDPYPFILLNLTLSLLAAIQAPFILMSQNRSTDRDRRKFEHDFAINRKAEREIENIQKNLEHIKRLIKKK